MLTEATSGVFTIAATPFLPDGAVDFQSIDRMVEFYAETGATGLTILGMMGEAGKLYSDESEAVIARVADRTDMPVIVGVSASGIASIAALSAIAMDRGAAGVMVAPPNTLRTDDQIISYFQAVTHALGDTPWVLQDFPLATSVQITPRTLRTIFDTCPSCKILKHEDWPGLEKITALRAYEAKGARRMAILCGSGGQFLIEEMLRGADGAMTGFAYPEMMRDVTALAHTDPEKARDIFDAYLPLIRYESQPGMGLAVRKHVLARRGAIAHSTLRTPGATLSNTAIEEIDTLIIRQEARLSAL